MTAEEFRDISRTLAEVRRIRELLRHEMESRGLVGPRREAVSDKQREDVFFRSYDGDLLPTIGTRLRWLRKGLKSRVSPVFDVEQYDKVTLWVAACIAGGCVAAFMWVFVYYPLLFG